MMNSTKSPPEAATPGTLHYVPPHLSAFEPLKPLIRSTNINTLLWVGGMFDTPHSVAYPFTIAQSLGPTWSLLAASLGSSGLGWGVSSISRDADDMAKLVRYIKEKRPGGKVVIMGHSTGCQDCMEYIVGKGAEQRLPVDGVVLQAPVSDREAMADTLPHDFKHNADQLALKMCREKQDKECMPNRLTKAVFGRMGITARRWLDVSSPGPDHTGADDYFSSDLPVERLKETFGKFPAHTPLLILYSGSDESVPKLVDKEKLVQRWIGVVTDAGGVIDADSGVVPGASHNYNGDAESVVQDLVARVIGFTSRIGAGACVPHI